MSQVIKSQVKNVIDELYHDCKTNEPAIRERLKKEVPEKAPEGPRENYAQMKELYMPINDECGQLLYGLILSTKAKNIIEFGTSFGLSALYMAAALQELGEGKVITTEYFQEKIDRSIESFKKAGVNDFIECRTGDAVETLSKDVEDGIDLVFLDGAKTLYFDVFKTILPKFKKGTIVVADNTNHRGLENYLEYVRNPENGFVSTGLQTHRNGGVGYHEISIKG